MSRPAGNLLSVSLLAACALGCASEAPPPGGALDLEPPALVGSDPADGEAGVPRVKSISLTFSEPMEKRETERVTFVSPETRWARSSWKGTTLTLAAAESLFADRVYVAVVGRAARDRHGNLLLSPVSFSFTTGESLPRGEVRGRVRPVIPGGPTRVYAVPVAEDTVPSLSPGEALSAAEVDSVGAFRLPSLAGGSPVWVVAYVDRNANGLFEFPGGEPWGWHPVPFAPDLLDTTTQVVVRLHDPRNQGVLRGRVRGAGGLPTALVLAVSSTDTSRVTVDETQGKGGEFLLPLSPGSYRVGAFLDLNANRSWDAPGEEGGEVVSWWADEIEIRGEEEGALGYEPSEAWVELVAPVLVDSAAPTDTDAPENHIEE